MQKNLLQFDQSEWWILLIIIVSVGLTWFLYSMRNPAWNQRQNWILSIIRFVAISLSLSLLLEPFINQRITRTEKPIVAIAVDNSQSVMARTTDSAEFRNKLQSLTENLENEDFEVRTFSLNDNDSLQFDHPTTNLFSLQQAVSNAMEGRNWVSTILLSDGIFNGGSSPIYKQYAVPQFTVGLGDTIPPKDINISRVLYNRVSFKGNETPIKFEITQNGFEGQEVTFNLTEKGKVVDKQTVKLNRPIQELEFVVKSEEEGLRRMAISTPIQTGEFVAENNRSSIFMEVIDGRQKVLVVANAPHPDIKAIRSVLLSTDNYQVDLYTPSLGDERPSDIYDVVIYHGAFSGRIPFNPKETPGLWYILGEQSSLNQLNNSVPFFNIRRRGSQTDNVTASFNQAFSKFSLPESRGIFDDYPPISIPFGEYNLSGPTEVLLYQRIGSIATKKPLFAFYDDGSQKGAILAGQNIWKWKLQESAINGNSNLFRDIVTKTVQFLSVKNDKQQFRFRSRGNNFSNLQSVFFDAEVYNDIYERTYGNRISLTITSADAESSEFEFIDSEYNSSFSVPVLESGIYIYRASVQVGDKSLTDRGQFLVEEINREYLNLTADHNLLRTLSEKTGAEYTHYANADQVIDKIRARDFKSIVKSSESYFPLTQSRWMLLIILLLFSGEWFLRKFWGGY
ncbi:MAG: hypothetical protein ABJP45_03505 [Cyclobacteriaceae bacterium]